MSPQKGPGARALGALADPRAVEEAARQDRHRNDDIADACNELEEDMEALKARFELYFLGIDRREPAREREEMKRRVAKLKSENVRNTGLRFRIQTLHARFLSYERMWQRSAREKEEGTYKRDLMRARRKRDTLPPKVQHPAADATAAPMPAAPPSGATAAAPASPGAAAARARAAAAIAAAPAPSAAVSETRLRALYDEFVAAKQRCGEDASRLTYDALARSVAKQVPELLAKYKARAVEFKVEVRDGRAVLKALPLV
jgi:hypothetical protein